MLLCFHWNVFIVCCCFSLECIKSMMLYFIGIYLIFIYNCYLIICCVFDTCFVMQYSVFVIFFQFSC